MPRSSLSTPPRSRLPFLWFFALAVACLAPTLGAQSFDAGYRPRACGFDLDDDGILGEPEDCLVCNGTSTDPDGDGVDEDLLYVDCDNGRNVGSCGTPDNPCLTLNQAIRLLPDGPDDGAEDIVCFRGTCSPSDLSPHLRGLDGFRIEEPQGAERAWQVPTNPAMLVGWDSDGDGAYPPFDEDDTAVLDGRPGSKERALLLNHERDNSFFEMAHFEVRDYGRFDDGEEGGFLKANQNRSASHIRIHDLEIRDVNREQPSASFRIVFDFFGLGGLEWFEVNNVRVENAGSFIVRGDAAGVAAGPFRFRRLEATALGCSEPCDGRAAFIGFKVWGQIDGLDILDSKFDCNPGPWTPQTTGIPGCVGIATSQCLRDGYYHGNEIVDFRDPFVIEGSSPGFCSGEDARTVDDIVIDGNLIRHSWAPLAPGMVRIKDGGVVPRIESTIEDVRITNNFFYTSVPYVACLFYRGGNDVGPNPGTIEFSHNTCWGPMVTEWGAITLRKDRTFPHQSFVVRNNLIGGLEQGDASVYAAFAPSDWVSNGNAFDPAGNFVWDGNFGVNFQKYRALSGGDGASSLCRADLESPETGDLRLRFTDDCAQDRGVPAGSPGFDGEGEVRTDPPDRGADEVSIGDRPALGLNADRFRVAAQWKTADGRTGTASPSDLSGDSAYFWFFDQNNVEIVLKVLDGCSTNGRFWVFGAGLTNVAASVRIEDSASDEVWTFDNPLGRSFPPVQDVQAFATCQ